MAPSGMRSSKPPERHGRSPAGMAARLRARLRPRVRLPAARAGREIVGVLPLVIFNSPLVRPSDRLAADSQLRRPAVERRRAAAPLVAAARDLARVPPPHVELRHAAPPDVAALRDSTRSSMRLTLPATTDAAVAVDRPQGAATRCGRRRRATSPAAPAALELADSFYQVFAREHARPGHAGLLAAAVHRSAGAVPAAGGDSLVRLRERPGRRRGHAALQRHGAGAVGVVAARPTASSVPTCCCTGRMLENAVAGGARCSTSAARRSTAGRTSSSSSGARPPEPQFWEYILLRGDKVPDQGPANDRFNLAIEAWRRLPLWIANAAGPHIVRNIP